MKPQASPFFKNKSLHAFCEDKTKIISQNNKLPWHYSISFPKELQHELCLMKKGEYRSGMRSLWTTEKNFFLFAFATF